MASLLRSTAGAAVRLMGIVPMENIEHCHFLCLLVLRTFGKVKFHGQAVVASCGVGYVVDFGACRGGGTGRRASLRS